MKVNIFEIWKYTFAKYESKHLQNMNLYICQIWNKKMQLYYEIEHFTNMKVYICKQADEAFK